MSSATAQSTDLTPPREWGISFVIPRAVAESIDSPARVGNIQLDSKQGMEMGVETEMDGEGMESWKLSSNVANWLAIAGFTASCMAVIASGAWTLYNSAMEKMDAGFSRLESGFVRVDAKFDQIDARFVRLESKMDRGFESVNDRFDEVNRRFEDVNSRFDDVNGRFDDVNGRFDDVNGRIDNLQGDVSDVRERVARIEVVVSRFHPNEAAAPP